LKPADIELLVDRYKGRRGMKSARSALELIDDGAQSPKETWLRLLLIRAGLPTPQTQIAVRNEWGYAEAYLDMGWENMKIAVEYDGDQHRTDRAQYVKDIRRLAMLERRGWLVIRVIAEDYPDDIVRRVREAFARRELQRA
jgi:very-short-patch-repair endonuclease